MLWYNTTYSSFCGVRLVRYHNVHACVNHTALIYLEHKVGLQRGALKAVWKTRGQANIVHTANGIIGIEKTWKMGFRGQGLSSEEYTCYCDLHLNVT
jgi:hypothetical protein